MTGHQAPVAEAGPPTLRWAAPPTAERTEPSFPAPAFSEASHDTVLAGRAAFHGRQPTLTWSRPRPRAAGPAERAVALVVDAVAVVAILGGSVVATSVALSRGLHWLYRDAAGGGLVSTSCLAIPLLVAVPVASALA